MEKESGERKPPHRLVLGQILSADSLKLLTPPLAGIGAELFDVIPLEFTYALRNVRDIKTSLAMKDLTGIVSIIK